MNRELAYAAAEAIAGPIMVSWVIVFVLGLLVGLGLGWALL